MMKKEERPPTADLRPPTSQKRIVICPFLVGEEGIFARKTARFVLSAVDDERVFLTLYITSAIAQSLQVDWVRGVEKGLYADASIDLVDLVDLLPTRVGTDEVILGPISGTVFSDSYSGPPLRYRSVVPAGANLVVQITNKSSFDIPWRDLVSAVFEVPGG